MQRQTKELSTTEFSFMNNKKYGIIYLITNNVNNKKYIGQTTRGLKERWYQHIYDARTKRTNMPLHLAMNKYGVDNFSIKEIDSAFSKEELNQKEKDYIEYYNSQIKHGKGYNIELGGENREIRGSHVYQFSLDGKEIKEFNSIASAARETGTSPSGISLCCQKKRRFSNDFQWCYSKNKDFIVGIRPTPQQKTSKSVIQYDDKNNIIKIWESATQASKELNIPRQHIYKVCKGERQHCGGYKWRYYNSKDNTPIKRKITNKGKPVQQFSLNNIFIREYPTIREAEKALGIKMGKSKIPEVCQGKRKTCGGYVWRYKKDEIQCD